MRFTIILFIALSVLTGCNNTSVKENQEEYLTKSFVHPGMFQGGDDLEYIRNKILAGEEPWKQAFENLKKEINPDFVPEPFTYISVGPYGSNDVGGKQFFASAKESYKQALMWYITRDKQYADKAIEILNAWAYKLWAFDANNAKLNVGLNGQYFLNAAEILRYTKSGWEAKDIEQFEQLVLTVFYPTIKDFFTEANGNWDASMINTMMCIAVFTNDHDMFNKAVERFYRGEGNSGITKYIYPGGQCQETTRDWDHVQLGIGELSRAAQVAWTQGIDLYAVADNRLAQGYEYAAKFLMGNEVEAFGDVSYRDRDEIRDIYESIYNHYITIKGIDLPYCKQIIDKFTRDESSIGFLTATRYTDKNTFPELQALKAEQQVKPTITGALSAATVSIPADAVWIKAGESIQMAIDEHKNSGKCIVLKKGVHWLEEPLRIPSGTILMGEGKESILILKPAASTATIVNDDNELSNVVIRDLLIEGATKPLTGFDPNHERNQRLYTNAQSREGIVFQSDVTGNIKNILLENITVQNFTKNGILISGASNVKISKCNLDNNGSSVVPGPYFHHNLKLTRSSGCKIMDSRFDSSLWGNGIEISFADNIIVMGNETARNKLSGIYCVESNDITIQSNVSEGNDRDGITIDRFMDGCRNVNIKNNYLQCNARY